MRFLAIAVALVATACDGDGARARCEFGGALTACPEAERTVEDACWRLVDCGALPVDNGDDDDDWGGCVDDLDRLTADRQRLVVGCVAVATCDELRVDNFCFEPAR